MTRLLLLAGTLVFMVGTAAIAQKPQIKKSEKAEILTAELFIAIRDHNPAAVKSALTRGADPNGRNWLDFTPLMWAAMCGNPQNVEMLLARGAKRDALSIYGSALTFATLGRHEKLAFALLDKGIAPDARRADGATPLMLAAANGQTSLVERLLQKKSAPNIKDGDGATALIYAARLGQTAAVQSLLKANADVNLADSHGRTALMYAAANGFPKVADLLLSRHAASDVKDKKDATALHLASRYSGDAAVIRSLLKSGADASVQDGSGQTPLSLAQTRGYEAAAAALRAAGAQASLPLRQAAAPEPVSASKAVANGLALVQSGMKTFGARARCSSCHHQGLGLMAVGLAAQRGFAVDKQLLGGYMMQLGAEGMQGASAVHRALSDPHFAKTIQAVDIGDFAIGGGYIFAGVIANKVPPNPGLAETALFTAQHQASDGHWGYGVERGPMQSSVFTTTALVLQVLRAYGPEEKLASCYKRAKQWLLTTPAPNAEDRASRLLGLTWVNVSKEEKEKPLRELLTLQRADGGWAQLPSLRSDAYATGIALYALKAGGGLEASDPAFQKGIQFLLRTQDEDGSWYVNKRAMPANTYFDAGFPHGESQYISFAATCWAIMALMEASGPTQTAALR